MSPEEHKIEDVLERIRVCVDKGRFTVDTPERLKNEDFLRKYLIKPSDRFTLLNSLTAKHYCESILDRKKDLNIYDEIMYVFGLKKKLKLKLENGKEETVEIYIKTQFFKMKNDNNDYTLLISFHKAEKPLRYMFE